MIDHLAEPTIPGLVETYLYKAVMFIRASRTVWKAVTSPVRWYTLCIWTVTFHCANTTLRYFWESYNRILLICYHFAMERTTGKTVKPTAIVCTQSDLRRFHNHNIMRLIVDWFLRCPCTVYGIEHKIKTLGCTFSYHFLFLAWAWDFFLEKLLVLATKLSQFINIPQCSSSDASRQLTSVLHQRSELIHSPDVTHFFSPYTQTTDRNKSWIIKNSHTCQEIKA